MKSFNDSRNSFRPASTTQNYASIKQMTSLFTRLLACSAHAVSTHLHRSLLGRSSTHLHGEKKETALS